MKSVTLYAHPPEPDGLSLQGHMLYKGMCENGEEVVPCHLASEFQKEWIYDYFKPDVAIGVGYWNYTPDIILHTQKFGVTPVPWLLADGWVANYHDIIGSLPLVLTTSDWVTKTYARDGVDTKNFVSIPIGIDTSLFRPVSKSTQQVKAIRKMIGVHDDELMILTAGGDVTSKGAQEIFQALEKVDREFKKWKYVCKIWGGGSADVHYEKEMSLINKLGASKDKVIYLEGQCSSEFMPYLLNAADIYAAPSRLEGFGMIQVEAQSCGIPVISIDKMGPKETIVHGETGFLARVASTVELTEERAYSDMGFDSDRTILFDQPKIFEYHADTDELADYLLRLLTNEKLRATIGKRAREHVLRNFEYHRTATQMSSLIKERLHLG